MNKKIETAIGNNIRALRENKNITQEILAAKLQVNGCDITRSAVAKIEVGQRHIYQIGRASCRERVSFAV